jgi:hypothetical protein
MKTQSLTLFGHDNAQDRLSLSTLILMTLIELYILSDGKILKYCSILQLMLNTLMVLLVTIMPIPMLMLMVVSAIDLTSLISLSTMVLHGHISGAKREGFRLTNIWP